MHLGGLVSGGVREQLHLVELMDPEQATGVTPRGAGLATKARRVGHEFHRQVGFVEHLVPTERGERHLGCGNGPQVVTFEVVGVLFELGKVPGGHHGLGLDERRRTHLPVGVRVAVQSVLDQCTAQGGPHAGVHHEHRTRELGAPFHVQETELFGDLPVGHPLVLAVGIGIPVLVADQHVVGLG